MKNKINTILLMTIPILITSSLTAFEFTFEPIDVVIPCHEKDLRTLNLAIEGIRKNGKNIRRVIVVSERKLTDKAEWFDERNFPFSKESIAYEIVQNEEKAQEFLISPLTRIGWIFQQILKSYSIFVIPNISSNVLLLDADTIFLRPVEFQDPETGAGLFNPGIEHYIPYFDHIARVLPGCKKIFPQYSGISHHMLIQRSVMEELYETIKNTHPGKEPWQIFCNTVDKNELFKSCMSIEYELYFNFVFAKTDKVKIRKLKFTNISFREIDVYKMMDYTYLSCHTHID